MSIYASDSSPICIIHLIDCVFIFCMVFSCVSENLQLTWHINDVAASMEFDWLIYNYYSPIRTKSQQKYWKILQIWMKRELRSSLTFRNSTHFSGICMNRVLYWCVILFLALYFEIETKTKRHKSTLRNIWLMVCGFPFCIFTIKIIWYNNNTIYQENKIDYIVFASSVNRAQCSLFLRYLDFFCGWSFFGIK